MGVYKAIRNAWDSIKGRFCFTIGNRRMVKFWKERWCSDLSLEESFPSLFFIALTKDALVAKAWE